MSVVPFTTQIGLQACTQGSQGGIKVVLVYTDKMTERQSALMKECQDYLCQNLGVLMKQANELNSLTPKMKYFVIPTRKEDIIKKIKSYFEKPILYLPRAIIEARGHYRVNLPVRKLAVSLTMHNCRVFLVKSCDQPTIKSRIHEMSGTLVTSFNDDNPNVVITDRADNKYCSRAFKKNIPVVCKDWLDDNYNIACEEESSFFAHDAMTSVKDHQIKPFFGLYFKILDVKNSGAQLRKLILANQGSIVYGDENCLTHIVGASDQEADSSDNNESDNKLAQKIARVDAEFIRVCAESQYYIPKREYREQKSASRVVIKDEPSLPRTQMISSAEENQYSPLMNRDNMVNENQASNINMLPPPSIPTRPLKPQSDNMDDMILHALSNPAQTQLASTQMRLMPDQVLRIERTFEPSQQLYWNDNVSKRNSCIE